MFISVVASCSRTKSVQRSLIHGFALAVSARRIAHQHLRPARHQGGNGTRAAMPRHDGLVRVTVVIFAHLPVDLERRGIRGSVVRPSEIFGDRFAERQVLPARRRPQRSVRPVLPVAHVDHRHLARAYRVGQNGIGDVFAGGELDAHGAAGFLLPFRHRVLKELLERKRSGELRSQAEEQIPRLAELVQLMQDECAVKRAADRVGHVVNLVGQVQVIARLDRRRFRQPGLIDVIGGPPGIVDPMGRDLQRVMRVV